MTAFTDPPHREAPQPLNIDELVQPARDEFGVPWCTIHCAQYDDTEPGHHRCCLQKLPITMMDICEPAARADAAELARLRREYDAAMKTLAAAPQTTEGMRVAAWPTLPELAEQVTRECGTLRADLAAARAELADLRAMRERALKLQTENAPHVGSGSEGGCVADDIAYVIATILGLTGTPAADAPRDEGKTK